MKKILAIILSIIITSCDTKQVDNPNNKEFKKGTVRIVLVDKYTCKVPLQSVTIKNSDLFGSWTDSVNWEYQKKCWYGTYNIDRRINFTFFPSKKYIWTETNTDSTINKHEQGEFWTYTSGDSSFIVMMHNEKQDTFFNQGQEGYAKQYLIYNSADRKITLRAKLADSDSFSKFIVEFIK